ncbi:MAG: nitroreductase family protein [Nanoarchaeota archaeon]|nr:nitroreductase family protein [Nanoarchaeota archaeon]
MDTISAIESRRSVREFSKKKPDWRNIIEAINSTQYAPMAGGIFSLKFLIIDKKDTIQKISKWSEQEFIQDVQYIVAFITDPKKTEISFNERSKKYLPQQAGSAIQNFMLHLTEIGLSTCWIGHFNDEKIKALLKIPKEMEIEAMFPIGFAKKKPKQTKKEALYEKLYFNIWGNKYMKKYSKIDGRIY